MKTCVSYLYNETPQSIFNCDFFAQVGIFESEDVLFVIVINGDNCLVEFPEYKNCIIIKNQNTHQASIDYLLNLYQVKDIIELPIDSFIFLDSSIIGPFIPSNFRQKFNNWVDLFTSNLNNQVKLIYTLLTCTFELLFDKSCYCVDKIGLNIIKNNNENIATKMKEHGYYINFLVNKQVGNENNLQIRPQDMIFIKWYYDNNSIYNTDIKNYIKSTLDDLIYTNNFYALYCVSEYKINITKRIKQFYDLTNTKLIFPEKCELNTYFPEHHKLLGTSKITLEIFTNKSVYNINNNIPYKGEISLKDNNYKLTASYGSYYTKVDVTNEFIFYFKDDNALNIPMKYSFNECFGDVHQYVPKDLYLKINENEFIINEYRNKDYNFDIDNIIIDLNIKPNIKPTISNIKIVYFAYINPNSNWEKIICGQLEQLRDIGLLNFAQLYVHIVCEYIELIKPIMHKINNINSEAIITISLKNQYEYKGIHLVWELANKDPDAIYLYFHSKGMSYNNNTRALDERRIYQEVICPWAKIINIFSSQKHINKIGYGSPYEGWVWFNFWWARGSYLKECVEPIVTSDRWYYERWLHMKAENTPISLYNECYSLTGNTNEKFYDAGQIVHAINSVNLIT